MYRELHAVRIFLAILLIVLLVIGEDIRKRESVLVTEIIDKTDRLILFAQLIAKLLLVDSEVDSYGNSNSSTYHRVVTHTEEAHHLYVSRN